MKKAVVVNYKVIKAPSVSAKPKGREPMSLQTPTFITVYSLKKPFIFSEKLFFFL